MCDRPTLASSELVSNRKQAETTQRRTTVNNSQCRQRNHTRASQADHASPEREQVQYSGWNSTLLLHSELPGWLQDNEYLLANHRPVIPDVFQDILTIFRLHTETINIWTHLIGVFVLLALKIHYLFIDPNVMTLSQRVTMAIYFHGSLVCLGASTIFHTFLNYSPACHDKLSRCDYAGIIFFVIASFVPWMWFGFYCNAIWRIIYIGLIISLGSLAMWVVLAEKFNTPQYREHRAAVFITLGLFGLVPGLHFILTSDLHESLLIVGGLITHGALYLTGGAIYAFRFPERFWPGRFDIWGHSHQVLHICVLWGALIGILTAQKLAEYRLTSTCPS